MMCFDVVQGRALISYHKTGRCHSALRIDEVFLEILLSSLLFTFSQFLTTAQKNNFFKIKFSLNFFYVSF